MGKDVIRPWSQRLTENVIKELEGLKEESGIETYSLFFETMIERYYNPIKINQENEKINADIKQDLNVLKTNYEKIEKENVLILEENNAFDSKFADLENYNKTLISNSSEVQSKNATLETEIAQLHEKLKNSVYVGPFNMKVLQKVAERETRNRGKDWNKSQIVNCIIDFRFIKGTLNAGFDSLPDHVITEIRKELE